MNTSLTNSSAMNSTATPLAETTEGDVEEGGRYFKNFPKMWLGVLGVLFCVIFLLNVVVGCALYKARRLKPVLRVLLFNLAVSDALAAIVNVYHVIAGYWQRRFTAECIFRYVLVIELATVTLGFMVVLSLDRVVAMVTALRYDQLVTTRRLWIVSIIVWTGSVIFPVAVLADVSMESERCFFQLFLPRYSFVMYGASCLAVIFFVVGLNLFTLRKTLGHIQQIAVTVVGEGKEARVAAMNHKAAMTSLVVILPFLLLCTPIYVLFFFFAFSPGLTKTLEGLLSLTVCHGLMLGNSFANPFIYVWRSLEVRAEVKRFLCLRKLFAQDNPPQPESRQNSGGQDNPTQSESRLNSGGQDNSLQSDSRQNSGGQDNPTQSESRQNSGGQENPPQSE